jgi:acetyl esterase/lipase
VATTAWEPPAEVGRDELIRISDEVLARPDLPITVREDVFRIRVAELDWDIGGMVYEPTDPAHIRVGADGNKVGIFLLHGGGGDHRGKDEAARFLATKFGYKVATMTYPGHLYLLDPSRDWPGDTINPDGTARTPLWKIDEPITPDQYELVQDRSDDKLRAKYGTLFFLRAKEGTDFYWRMASWPWAFEEAMKAVCARNFPVGEYSVYAHGHSTGGPFVHMLLQRVENMAGLVGLETSAFGYIFSKMLDQDWPFTFDLMTVRTWRDTARYAGPERGMEGVRKLAWTMEEIIDSWQVTKKLPGMKSQHFVTQGATGPLGEAARVTAKRFGMSPTETEALVAQFQGYTREMSGPGTRPLPPLFYAINTGSRDHTVEKYRTRLLPALAELDPAPKARVIVYHAGVHSYERPEEGLPRGTLPVAAEMWDRAISGGYYLAS